MSKFTQQAMADAIEEYNEIYGKKVKYTVSTPTKPVTKHYATDQQLDDHGSVVYGMSPELELYTLACMMGMGGSFYTKNKQSNRIKELIGLVHPAFAAKLAIYAREKMYMRSIPVVIAMELAKTKDGSVFVAEILNRVIKRPDDITEALSYYQYTNAREGVKKLGRISNQVKKGIRMVFESGRFDEYQFAKYNRSTEVKLRDALFLTHPKPKNSLDKKLFTKIANNALDVPYTWETTLSQAGKEKRNKKEVWEELIDSGRLGYMALLRNLRNILSSGVSSNHISKVCDIISDRDNVLKSKQLPFRFLSAYRSLYAVPDVWDTYRYDPNGNVDDGPDSSMLVKALSTAARISVESFPDFKNDNALIAADVSGSMMGRITPKSLVRQFDIGVFMSALASLSFNDATTGFFGDSFKTVEYGLVDTVFDIVEQIYKREGEVGYSTFGYKVLEYALESGKVFDKIMIFTDCQIYDESMFEIDKYSAFEETWKNYRLVSPDCKLYLFDLNNSRRSVPLRICDNNVYMIAGWSDKIFDVMSRIENGGNALDDINDIKL